MTESNEVDDTKSAILVPTWFKTTAWVAMVWNLMGVGAFIDRMMMTAEDIALKPEAEQLLYQDIPTWATIAFGVAVWGGALGCLLLALRKSLAQPVLVISLFGVLVQMYHAFFIIDSVAVFGPGSAIMPGMVILIAIGLIVLANKAGSNEWLS